MIPGKKYVPEDYVRMAWRRKWLVALPWLLVTCAVVAGGRFLPTLYRSETLIQIVPPRLPDGYVRPTATNRVEDRLQLLRQQILNRANVERLIEEFGLYGEPRHTANADDLAQRLRNDVTMETVKGEAIRVAYVSQDPRSAMKVTEKLASLVIEENLRDRESLAEGTSQFFEVQLEDARQRLVAQEKALEAYRRQHSGELPSQLESNLQVIQNAQLQIQTLNDSLNRDRDRRLVLERSIADLSKPAPSSPQPTGASSADDLSGAPAAVQLEAARTTLQTMQLRLKADHPDIIRMNREIRDLEARARVEEAMPRPPASVPVAPDERRSRIRDLQAEMANVDRQIAYKQTEEQRLRGSIELYQQRVDAAPTRESELIGLTRDYDTLRNLYTSLLARREDSKISANLERRQIGEQFRVIDPARLPETPFSPNLLRINLLGILAGLGVGLLLAGLFEYLDTSLRTDDDVVETLALPVLATVPLIASSDRFWHAKGRHVIAGGGVAVVVAASIAALIWSAPW